MVLSIEIRTLAALLLIATILMIGLIATNIQKDNYINQMAFSYNQNLETIETYCDLNYTELNEIIRQQNLNQILNNSNQLVTNQ